MVSPRILESKSFLVWICFLVVMTNYAVLSGPVLSKDVARGVDYLIRFGYLVQKDPRTGSLRTRAELERSVKVLQRYAGIPETGVLDAPTVKLMGQSRCGVSDFGKSDNARRKRRYFLQGTWWKKTNLTYKINSYSRDLPRDQQRATFRQAFSLWSAVTPLNIKEVHGVPDDKVDILIGFGSGYHGDPYPFDGNGGTLAHAYYPHNNRGLSGDAHFDADERFTTGTKDGINLDWVAVHEFGHSLGLEHSNVRESIMYPWYKGYIPNIKLTYDDIQGIQALYGRANNPTTPATTRKPVKPHTRSTTSPPGVDVCSVSSYDTLFIGGDSKTYAFYGEYYWVISSSTGVEKGPLKISNKWPDLKTPVDAAYTRLDGNTVFFRGSQFWQYKEDTLDKGPRPISEYGLTSEMRDMDAVFVWGRNRRTYFFKGTKYWRYDDTNNRVDYGYPRNITVWKGVPSNINAAMKWRNGRTYFFKGSKYVRLDDWEIQVDKEYPKSIAIEWMSCEKENLNQPTEHVMETSRDQSNCSDSTDPKNASSPVVALRSFMIFTLYSVVAMIWLV